MSGGVVEGVDQHVVENAGRYGAFASAGG